ncbi:MAG: PAS domain S-box protein [Campylobacteraceae bacterium]|nr:PAS domain S-box protein [Campylobacteraceae bacterium]
MSTNELVVVGIGSSAGGLEALQIMLAKVSDNLNCSYIIAQHLSPTHRSMMVELLSRITNIPVVEVQNGIVIKAKTIYMTQENTDIYVNNGKIYLKNVDSTYGPKPSVNYFFNSLAQSYGSRCIGVILSGTGSDGAFGIRAIKASGGITIAQSPQSAKYDGMPISAINTGKVDIVASIENISTEIARIIDNLGKNIGDSINETIIQQIYRIIFEEKGVDFSQYKRSTIVRRIERRLAAVRVETLNDYVDYLKMNVEEVTNLYYDMLIGVTEFFRDADVFEEVKEQIKNIIEKKEQGEEIRFWSIGCSTGEEPYSLAILLSEILKDKITKYKIKIFATDIDDESLKIARSGIYAETSLLNMDKDLVNKYFTIQKNHFEVKKSIRELVVFSKHNIISDSPFLRVDLISCRNMLIYFNAVLQKRFFPIVHYALKDSGVLVLGKSETTGEHYDLFVTQNKTLKVYKTQFTGVKELPRLYNYGGTSKNYEEPKSHSSKNDEEILEEKITQASSEYLLNQCVLINSSNDILYIKGDIPFLALSAGRATTNIFKTLKEELTLEVRSVLNEATKSKTFKSTQYRAVTLYGELLKYVRVLVVPIKNDKNDDWFYALFFQTEDIQNLKGYILESENENETIINLTSELAKTKSHLQNVIEELETSYEEMQSLNEELSSSNEELQSSNEELETTNEELQSTNEELQTAYSELKVVYDDKDARAKQLEDLTKKLRFQTDDLRKQKELTETIIDTTPVAILMTDTTGKINFSNVNAQNLFRLSKTELLDRMIDDNHWNIQTANGDVVSKNEMPINIIKKSFESVRNVVLSLETGEKYRIVVSISGSPLFDLKGDFIGIVFSVEDITQTQLLQQQIEKYENLSEIHIEQKIEKSFAKLKVPSLLNHSSGDFNLLQMGMLDISTGLKNSLAEATLLTSALEHNEDVTLKKELTTNLNQLLLNMNALINGNISYYNNLYFFKELDFVKLLSKTLLLFSYSFEQNGLVLTHTIEDNLIIDGNSKEVVLFTLHLIESILALEVSSCVITLKGTTLVLEVEPKECNPLALQELLQYNDQQYISDLFHQKIEKIEVETL